MSAKPNNSGVIEIHGKQYETVALRVKKFREVHGNDLSLATEIVHRDAECVVMRATISKDGMVLATGHAEEYRHTSSINKTSALENCETSAIGRALATLGLGGTEFASADELKRAIVDKQSANGKGVLGKSPTTEQMEEHLKALPVEDREHLRRVAADIEALIEEERETDAWAMCEAALAEAKKQDAANETDKELFMRMGLWSLLGSKARAAIKRVSATKKAN